MGPSLRVRPHRPTYMRLQKDHQKPAKKKRRRRREMPRHPPTHPGWRVSAFRPTHRHPPPIPLAETPTPSQQPAAPACLPPSPARLPTRLLQPNLVIRETLPTQLTKWWARLSGTAGRPRPRRRPSLAPPLLLPPPTHTFVVVLVGGRGLMSIYYVCCPKLPVYNDTTTKKARVQRTFYPISL